MNNDYKAILLMLDGGHKLPKNILTKGKIQNLTRMEMIYQYEGSWLLTSKGKEAIKEDIKIVYPLSNEKGEVLSYNKTIHTMSRHAKEALLCAIINDGDFFDSIKVSTFRVFIQHLLDADSHKKWGRELNEKLLNVAQSTKEYHDKHKVKER